MTNEETILNAVTDADRNSLVRKVMTVGQANETALECYGWEAFPLELAQEYASNDLKD